MKPKPKEHYIRKRGGFITICWCGGDHRIVRSDKTERHANRKPNIVMLEDIEAQ